MKRSDTALSLRMPAPTGIILIFAHWEQLARELHGVLIVEEPSSPEVDQDLVSIFDDWRIGKYGQIDETSFGSLDDLSHTGRLGNILTHNGRFKEDFPILSSQRNRQEAYDVLLLQTDGTWEIYTSYLAKP